ncbi:MAG TPA: hypothetical protein VKB93_05735 [Thermoanaerobaculia bacterium]|nr:hypothetical protein [Thermoanaerobaculia bacterium]
MSLKVFHIVFVIVTTILSLFVALWGIREFAQQKSAGGLILSLVFLAAAVGLMVYGKKVWAKFKEIPVVLLVLFLLFIADSASACPVCYGAPGDPMVKGTNNGVWVLLGVVGFVQVGFIAMFWSFWRRAKAQKRFRDQFHVIEGGPHS